MKKILITGFEAFLGESLNPSALLLEKLKDLTEIDTLLLPVEFEGAFQKLRPAVESGTYQGVLLLGLAGGASRIRLERVGLNLLDASAPDESGVLYLETPLDPQAPTALMTSLPLRAIYTDLKTRHPNLEISNSAGAYVCNATYFKALNLIREKALSTWALFVHIPYLPEQILNKPAGTPSLSLEADELLVRDLLRTLSQFQ